MRLVLVLLVAVSCSNKQKQFDQELSTGRCEDAMLSVPERDPLVRIVGQGQQAANTVLSYAFVGASCTTEVLLDVAGGAVMAVVLCAIPIAGHANQCIPGPIDALASPPLGRWSVPVARKMRCPNLESLSRSIRSVAGCFAARGDHPRARLTLDSLRGSEGFYSCLSLDEQMRVQKQWESLGTAATSGARDFFAIRSSPQ